MRKVRWAFAVLAGLGVVFLLLGVVGFGPVRPLFHRPISAAAHGGIDRIELVAIPEGPGAPAFQRTPDGLGGAAASKPLSLIQRYIPEPLPAPLPQLGCGLGGDLVVTFADGKRVTYGPCRRPPVINDLWARMIFVIVDGKCAPRCGPGGAPGP